MLHGLRTFFFFFWGGGGGTHSISTLEEFPIQNIILKGILKHSYNMANPSQLSLNIYGLDTITAGDLQDDDMNYTIFPCWVKNLLESSNVKGFQTMHLNPVDCPGLTAI